MKCTLLFIIILTIAHVRPMDATNAYAQSNDPTSRTEENTESAPASEAADNSIFDIHYQFCQFYPGVLFSKGIANASGSYQSIGRVNKRYGDSMSYGLFFGFVFNEHHAAEFAVEQAKYTSSVTRFYNTYSTETEYTMTTREYMVLYRLNFQRYFLKIGPMLFTKRGAWSSKTYVSNSSAVSDPAPSPATAFGNYLSIGHLFHVYGGLHVGTELFFKYPFATQWKSADTFKVMSYGLTISMMYLI